MFWVIRFDASDCGMHHALHSLCHKFTDKLQCHLRVETPPYYAILHYISWPALLKYLNYAHKKILKMSKFIFFSNYPQSISYLNKIFKKQFKQVIISDNRLLFEEITSYEHNIQNRLVGNQEQNLQELDIKEIYIAYSDVTYKLPPKIDLLIIDSPHYKDLIVKSQLHKARYIINLTENSVTENDTDEEREIFFKFPIKLINFMKVIDSLKVDNFLFAAIKNNSVKADIIYDEQKRCLNFTAINDQKFHRAYLTEKENELFKYLLFHANMPVHKSELQENIWKYNTNVESLTIETHLYRLKQKVPNNLIESSQNACKLVAAEVFI